MSIGQRNTASITAPNAVDASMWPGSQTTPPEPLTVPGPAFECETLYPSPDCGLKPSLTPAQLASIISNITSAMAALGQYLAKNSGSNEPIDTCEASQGSLVEFGRLLGDVLDVIQIQIDDRHPPAGIVSSDSTILSAGSNVLNQTFDLQARPASETETGIIRIATAGEVSDGAATNLAITPATLSVAASAITAVATAAATAAAAAADKYVSSVVYNPSTGQLTLSRANESALNQTITNFAPILSPTPPALTTNDQTVPTAFYGGNTARLGNPSGFWIIGPNKGVPFYDL